MTSSSLRSLHTRGACHLFGAHQQRYQERRRKGSPRVVGSFAILFIVKLCPPRSRTIRRATRKAPHRPRRKGTPASAGTTSCTKVISGCADAMAAPRFLSACIRDVPTRHSNETQSSAAIRPHSKKLRALADLAIWHAEPHRLRPDHLSSHDDRARADLRREHCVLSRDAHPGRDATSVTRWSASRNESASAVPQSPAPTIAMLGLFARFPAIEAE